MALWEVLLLLGLMSLNGFLAMARSALINVRKARLRQLVDEGVASARMAERLAEDAHRLLPGEGVIPLDDILTRLKQIGFDGLCSIELFRPEYWERDPAKLATAARAATLDIVGEYWKVE